MTAVVKKNNNNNKEELYRGPVGVLGVGENDEKRCREKDAQMRLGGLSA